MKSKIHPNKYKIKISCNACKQKFDIVSSTKNINIDVCSSCHPFYTNQAYSARSIGRVEKFRNKYNKK